MLPHSPQFGAFLPMKIALRGETLCRLDKVPVTCYPYDMQILDNPLPTEPKSVPRTLTDMKVGQCVAVSPKQHNYFRVTASKLRIKVKGRRQTDGSYLFWKMEAAS